MINWKRQPAPADKTILLHVSCEKDGTSPRNIKIKSNLVTSESESRSTIARLLGDWVKQYESVEKKPKSACTRGRDFTIGLYFYADGRPIEMRSDTGDYELVKKFVTVTKKWLKDEKSSIQLNQMESVA